MTEQTKVAVVKTETVKDIIMSDAMKRQFKAALPKHLTPEKFVRVALTAINRTPKLLECTKESLMECLLDLAQLGLEPDNRQSFLIPYGNKATLIISYKGLVELARRSGEIADIHSDCVCKNDFFEYSFGNDSKLIHKPAIADRGPVIAAYSYVRLKDGTSSFEVMNKEEVDEIRKRSKAGQAGPWVTDFNEMSKKTVFRRHSKWLPVSSEKFQLVNEKDYDVPIDITPVGKPVVEQPREITKKPEEIKPSPTIESPILISTYQANKLYAFAKGNGWSEDSVHNVLMHKYNLESAKGILKSEFDNVLKLFSVKNPNG